MNKIIFLDIDGVLNSQNTFKDNHIYRKFFAKYMNESINDKIIYVMLNIDLDKVFMIRDICNLMMLLIIFYTCVNIIIGDNKYEK